MPKTYLNPRDTKCSQSGSISSCRSHPPAAYRAAGPHGEQRFGVSRRAPRRPLSRSLTTNTTNCPASGRALFCMERKAVLPFLLSTKKGLMAHKALMAHTFFSAPTWQRLQRRRTWRLVTDVSPPQDEYHPAREARCSINYLSTLSTLSILLILREQSRHALQTENLRCAVRLPRFYTQQALSIHPPQTRHPERSASQSYLNRGFMARSRRTSAIHGLLMQAKSFSSTAAR